MPSPTPRLALTALLLVAAVSGCDNALGNDIEGFVPISHLSTTGAQVNSPADVAWEGMLMNVRILEVDPIHRRIVLGVVDVPAGQERPAEPSKVHTEDEIPEIPADLDPDMEA